MFVKTGHEQLCPYKYLCGPLQLLHKARARFQALLFFPPAGGLLFPSEALCLVQLGSQVGKVPCSDVDLSHLLAIPAALVVVDAAVALLQSQVGLRAVTKSGRPAECSTCAHYSSHLGQVFARAP